MNKRNQNHPITNPEQQGADDYAKNRDIGHNPFPLYSAYWSRYRLAHTQAHVDAMWASYQQLSMNKAINEPSPPTARTVEEILGNDQVEQIAARIAEETSEDHIDLREESNADIRAGGEE